MAGFTVTVSPIIIYEVAGASFKIHLTLSRYGDMAGKRYYRQVFPVIWDDILLKNFGKEVISLEESLGIEIR